MIESPKGPQAARWRQRKFRVLERFEMPSELLPGSLSESRLRCGRAGCHCAQGEGHPVWQLTYMRDGRKQVQHIPRQWVEQVRRRVEAGREFQQAVREVLTANAELLVLAKKQRRKKKAAKKKSARKESSRR